ncbi:MAG: hypothetical protein H8E33_00785 [Candidatus Cloacimonetes bacterium]|nr:hypothetical protein [Candidatus Cloacimonadota bacterium]MBL7107990.1 hypothetical protein [Candidatus Cloacimonadota bacterium]
MFKIKRSQEQNSQKLKIPKTIWILLILASIFGLMLTNHCHKQRNEFLEVKNIEIETESSTFAQIYFEIENKADFFIKRKVIVRLYSGNLELGSKMIISKLKKNHTTGFVVTIGFEKVLKENEGIDEISVRFYD